jgi:alkylation response protein AidB-like acyl-CoA dehydrogenase
MASGAVSQRVAGAAEESAAQSAEESAAHSEAEFAEPPDRAALRAAVRAVVTRYATHERIRDVMTGSDDDTALWDALSHDLAVTGLLLPAAGEPARFADLAVVVEELGRGPACVPFLGSAVLAPALLRGCTGAEAEEVAAQLRRPGTRASAGLEHAIADAGAATITAKRDGDAIRLHGEDAFVVDAPGAQLMLLAGELDGEVAIFAVAGDAPSLVITPLTAMDQTRRVGRVTLDGAPARCLATGAAAVEALATARRVAQVAIACEQVGGAARCLELTVDYAKQRRQFGVPIGSFQAVKHACADMLAALELSRTAAQYAAYCVEANPDDLPTAALLAASLCAESYLDIAAKAIQVHGGIGFTWDNYCHLYFKRAKASALMYGQPVACRRELAALIGL